MAAQEGARAHAEGNAAGEGSAAGEGNTAGESSAADEGSKCSAADALEAALAQLGPFGLYQGYTLVLLCIPSMLSAMYSLNYVFVADSVPFRCVVPECEGSAPSYASPWAEALLAGSAPCRRPAPGNGSLESLAACDWAAYLHTDVVCDRLVYENYDTTFAEFDLGCREWLRTLVGSVRNAALPFSLILTGFVSDNYGRRTALCIFSACIGSLGIVKSFSVNYPMYLALEFLEAALGYGFASAAYVMMIEMSPSRLRAACACASGAAYGAGGALLAALAWRAPHWRLLLRLAHAPALLLPLYALLLPESARWLHARRRPRPLRRALATAARWNKVTLDDAVMKRLERSMADADDRREEAGALRAVLRSRALRARLLLCGAVWAATTFVYYGLTINAVRLAGDKYVNFALNMAMEIVASLLIVMALERVGRKRSISCAFLLCLLACVLPLFITEARAALLLSLAGKLAVTFAFDALYVLTAELFPTRARSSALAASSLLGRLGSVLAPQTPLLSATAQALVYGACAACAALAVLALPETRRARLPHDVTDAERMREPPAAPSPPPPPLRRVLSADTADER